jgi:glutamine synthetase
LLFLCAVIKGVDEYQYLLRVSVASAGNDHRLGGNEAPPAILSIFLGDELTSVLNALEANKTYNGTQVAELEIGVNVLPNFAKDSTDRNRTSPFAFTGNKFEFRMLGSASSIACPNIMLNTIVAQELCEFADVLEPAPNFKIALQNLISDTIKKHKRIIFNGNNYCENWKKEAKKRGLLSLETTADAVPYLVKEKNIKLFQKNSIYTEAEIVSRHDIVLENYCKVIDIEAKTMINMAKKQIIPALISYIEKASKAALNLKKLSPKLDASLEENLLKKLCFLSGNIWEKLTFLEDVLEETKKIEDLTQKSLYFKENVIIAMKKLREVGDEIEKNVAKEFWPYADYSKLLFSVR